MKKTFKKIYCTDFNSLSDIPLGNALIIHIKIPLVSIVCLCLYACVSVNRFSFAILASIVQFIQIYINDLLPSVSIMSWWLFLFLLLSSKSYGKADNLKCLTLWMRLNSLLIYFCFLLQVNTIIRILLFFTFRFLYFWIIITITPWESLWVCVFVGMLYFKRIQSRCNSFYFMYFFVVVSICKFPLPFL